MLPKVVITGLGVTTSQGSCLKDVWDKVKTGQSFIKKIEKFDITDLPTKIGGEILNFNPEGIIEPVELRKLDKFCAYGIFAAFKAIEDAKLERDNLDATRMGVSVGSGFGGAQEIYDNVKKGLEKGFNRLSPFFIPKTLINMLSGNISQKFGLKGPNTSIVTACATGAHSIIDGCRTIQFNEADIMVCGGAEAALHPLAIGGFCAARALSTNFNDAPEKACRPWDKQRDGFVMSDGAAILILENEAHAKKRGAKIYAEIVGYGSSSDAYHMTAPDPHGQGASRAITLALKKAGIEPENIGYINAHATSTGIGDTAEIRAIKSVFGDTPKNLCVSSTKSTTGHLLGAAGSFEVILSIMALLENLAPPTINCDDPEEEFARINLVQHQAQVIKTQYALSNSFGFGGTNAAIIVRKYS